ncbi:2320_t:CDS:2, partial [Paraglomus brasilianum]
MTKQNGSWLCSNQGLLVPKLVWLRLRSKSGLHQPGQKTQAVFWVVSVFAAMADPDTLQEDITRERQWCEKSDSRNPESAESTSKINEQATGHTVHQLEAGTQFRQNGFIIIFFRQV